MRIAFYKSRRPGIAGIYNWLVQKWTKSQYSHVEVEFNTGICASASYLDGGVRFKEINFSNHNWDFIEVSDLLQPKAVAWFNEHEDSKYDLFGNAHFILGGVGDSPDKWFCSEAVAAALGMTDPWRYDPATLYSALQLINTKGYR